MVGATKPGLTVPSIKIAPCERIRLGSGIRLSYIILIRLNILLTILCLCIRKCLVRVTDCVLGASEKKILIAFRQTTCIHTLLGFPLLKLNGGGGGGNEAGVGVYFISLDFVSGGLKIST